MSISYQDYQLIDPTQYLDPLELLLIAEGEDEEADRLASQHQPNVVTPRRPTSDDAFS